MLIANRYRLEREVGRGGMGAVWLARDTVLGRHVALKRVGLFPGAEGADLDRVSREARVSAMLNHAHVVAVYDLVTEDHHHWLVMEYLESKNLAQVIKEGGPLSPDETSGLMVQAATALAAAHEAGIVHRDVKPSNMLITSDRRLKLSDFGIARTGNDPSLTQTGMVTGSPGYLSPEVAAGHGATAASDMWSFGATIFHAVTGQPPYDTSENLMGALYRIVHEDPVRTDRAGWLDPLLRATMHSVPAERWTARQAITFLRDGPGAPLAAPMPLPASVAAPSAAAAPATDTSFLPTVPPAPAPPAGKATPPARKKRKRGWLTPLLAVLGVLVVVGLTYAGWQLGSGDDDSTNRTDPGPTSTAPTSPPPSSPSESSTETPDISSMANFAIDYVTTAAEDPRSGFAMLTPEYQAASGGYAGYSGFWGDVSNVRISNVTADPEAMTTSYDFSYDYPSKGRVDERVTLNLTLTDGTYLINSAGSS